MPLPINDLDTDQIIPARYLTRIGKDGYGEGCFRQLRDQDPDFPLNQEKYADAQILISGGNFGCGSSREHAVWALKDYGFKVIIASSFADIFYSNSGKNGLVLIQLPEEVIQLLWEKIEVDPTYAINVDLDRQKICLADDSEYDFDFDPFRKECILKGYDDLDYLLSNKEQIEKWQSAREEDLFYSTLEPNR